MPGPGGKVGLHPQLETLCFPEFPQCLFEGLPQPPEPGKGKLAPSVCPPTQPSPVPHGCHGTTAVPAQPHSPPHDLRAFSLCSSFPLGHGWAMAGPWWGLPAGPGHVGGAAPGGHSLGYPFPRFSPAHFTAHPPAALGTVSLPSRRECQGFGARFMGAGDPLKAALFSLAPSPPPPFPELLLALTL